MYQVAKKIFARENFVSTAMLQRYLGLPYSLARQILDRMIGEGFAEEQETGSAWPCRVVKYTN